MKARARLMRAEVIPDKGPPANTISLTNASQSILHSKNNFMKATSTHFTRYIAVLLMLAGCLVTATSAQAQDPCTTGQCTSNDLQIARVYFVDAQGNPLATCSGTATVTAYIKIDVASSASRDGMYFYAQLTVGSASPTVISNCFMTSFPNQSTTTITYPSPVEFQCGQTVTLSNVYLAWGTGSGQYCPATCGSPKCWRLPTGQFITIEYCAAPTGVTDICAGSTTQLIAPGVSGTATWTTSNSTVATVSGTTGTALVTGHAAGDAIISFTSSNGCTASTTVHVSAAPTVSLGEGSSTSTCSNASATVAGVTHTGGDIMWTVTAGSDLGTLSGADTDAPTFTPDEGAEGTVTLMASVTGSGVCAATTVTATYTIDITAAPSLTVAEGGGSTVTCSDGAVTVSGFTSSGGNILWTVSEGGSLGSLSDETTDAPTFTPNAGATGHVVLLATVTGSGACSATTVTATYTIDITGAPAFTEGGDGSGSANICENSTAMVTGVTSVNGNIAWTIQSGTGSITAGANTDAPTFTPNGDGTTVLLATLTGSGDCAASVVTTTYTFNVQAAPTLTIDGGTSSSTILCENGSVQIQAEASGYNNVFWNFVSVPPGTAILYPGSLNPTFYVNVTGTYVFSGTAFGTGACQSSVATVTYTINVYGAPSASTGEENSTTVCSNGSVTVGSATASNGDIMWTHNGNGTLTNATSINPTYTPAPSDAGHDVVLTLTVTGNGVCGEPTATATYTIHVESCAATFRIDRVDPSCYGASDGKIVITNISGGTSPYQISNNNGFSFVPVDNPALFEFKNLPAGVYNIILKLGDGSLQPLSTTSLLDPPAIKATLSVDGLITCSSGTVKLNVSNVTGGHGGPFMYSVDGGAFTSSTMFDVGPGTHTVTISDNKGCAMDVGSVNVEGLPAVMAGDPVVTNVSSYGGSNGSISVMASGGTGNYNITVQTAGGAPVTINAGTETVTFTGLKAGTYTITVQDANGCGMAMTTATIEQPEQGNLPPDLVLGSESDMNTFKEDGEEVTLLYHISNVSASGDAFQVRLRITKPTRDYLVTLPAAATYTNTMGDNFMLDNAKWTITDDNDLYTELTLDNDPGGNNFVAAQTFMPRHITIKVKRTGGKGEFAVTGVVFSSVPDSNDADNSTIHRYNAQ
ncbi:MAG: Ig-like domain-containing protein [Flavisolibacter sp.]